MDSIPLISIIVPNFNHANFLEKRIESILNQTIQDFELIILDDCSTDESRKVIDKYKSNSKVAHLDYSKSNSGSPFKQWEKGLKIAKGKYIWIAESDDYCENNFLESCLHKFKEDSSLLLVFCGSHWVDEVGEIKKNLSLYSSSFKIEGKTELKNVLSKYNSIQNVSSVLFSSRWLKKISNRYTKYKSCGDWILYSELLVYGKIQFISDKLNYFRWYHNNTSNSSFNKGLWEFEGVDVLEIIKKSLNFTWQEKYEIVDYWIDKIKESRRRNKVSILNYFLISYKIFLFSKKIYLKKILN